MSARLVASGAILVAAVAICANWWAQYTGTIPKYEMSSTQGLVWLLIGPFVPALSVRAAIAIVGTESSDLIYRIWITILAGVNTTVSGIVLDAANSTSRTHAIFSRLLLVLDLLNMFWIFSLFSPDALYHLWHTDRTYLFNSAIFTQMTPHIAVNIIGVGIWAESFLPLHLGVIVASLIDAGLFYMGIKAAYTPIIREKYRRADGHPTLPDNSQYANLRKSVE